MDREAIVIDRGFCGRSFERRKEVLVLQMQKKKYHFLTPRDVMQLQLREHV
jgi:hypothetical protein